MNIKEYFREQLLKQNDGVFGMPEPSDVAIIKEYLEPVKGLMGEQYDQFCEHLFTLISTQYEVVIKGRSVAQEMLAEKLSNPQSAEAQAYMAFGALIAEGAGKGIDFEPKEKKVPLKIFDLVSDLVEKRRVDSSEGTNAILQATQGITFAEFMNAYDVHTDIPEYEAFQRACDKEPSAVLSSFFKGVEDKHRQETADGPAAAGFEAYKECVKALCSIRGVQGEVSDTPFSHLKVDASALDQFRSEVLESDMPVLVDFWAPWCAPCRAIAPILDDIDEQVDVIKIYKVNADVAPDVMKEYGVKSLPTLIMFNKGQELERITGGRDKLGIIRFIEESLNK